MIGCDANSFNCDDWMESNKIATCIPLKERCDGIAQCPTGKDEKGCSTLVEHFGKHVGLQVGRTSGFLYRNYRSKWYPVCSNAEVWAKDICNSESGHSELPPLTHLLPTKIKHTGLYISALEGNSVDLTSTCVPGRAVHVECPQPTCGTRILPRNPFRRSEVDTSVEDEEYTRTKNTKVDDTNGPIVGAGRVVGGRPSQPGAWPFIVSIYRNGVFHCGGTIISPSWVVTAAHCMDK